MTKHLLRASGPSDPLGAFIRVSGFSRRLVASNCEATENSDGLDHRRPELGWVDDLDVWGEPEEIGEGLPGFVDWNSDSTGASGIISIESKTKFLAAVTRGHISAIAKPIHLGTTLVVVETDVRDNRGKLVARVNQTQLVLSQRGG